MEGATEVPVGGVEDAEGHGRHRTDGTDIDRRFRWPGASATPTSSTR